MCIMLEVDSFFYLMGVCCVKYFIFVIFRSVYAERDRGFAAFAKEWSKYNKPKSFIQNATATEEHDFSLFYLDQRRKPRSLSRSRSV